MINNSSLKCYVVWARYSLGTTSFFCLNSPCIVVATSPLRSGNFCESLEVSRSLGSQRTSNTTNDQQDFDPKNAMLLRLIIINKPKPNPNLGGSAPQTPRDFGKVLGVFLKYWKRLKSCSDPLSKVQTSCNVI